MLHDSRNASRIAGFPVQICRLPRWKTSSDMFISSQRTAQRASAPLSVIQDYLAGVVLAAGRLMRVGSRKVSESRTRETAPLVVPTQSLEPHVLVAACDDGVRDARERQLRAFGLRVRLARTGFEAIVKASCYLPSLILLDASLGSDEVEETSRLLGTCPSTAHIPIVRLTPRRRVPQRIIQHLTAAAVL
jgi:CheY-like chemotaxis protein